VQSNGPPDEKQSAAQSNANAGKIMVDDLKAILQDKDLDLTSVKQLE
jgi:hypothetical protein